MERRRLDLGFEGRWREGKGERREGSEGRKEGRIRGLVFFPRLKDAWTFDWGGRLWVGGISSLVCFFILFFGWCAYVDGRVFGYGKEREGKGWNGMACPGRKDAPGERGLGKQDSTGD
jgi:hypothetical protein